MNHDRVEVWEALVANGVPEKDLMHHLQVAVFPWHTRVLYACRLLCGGNPFTAEWGFLEDLAHCSSDRDVADALFDYRANPERRNRRLARLFGLAPHPRRVLAFYAQVSAPRAGGLAPQPGVGWLHGAPGPPAEGRAPDSSQRFSRGQR